MNDVNLDDLKIDHSGPTSGKRGFSLVTAILFLLIGIACGYGILHFWPELMVGEVSKTETLSPGSNIPSQDNTNTQEQGEVEQTPVKDSFTEGGWIEVPSYHPIMVSALIPGRLEELKVLEGAKVKKGDEIAVLYQKDKKDELDRAEAAVQVAEADLKRLKAGFRVQEVEKARAEVQAADADLAMKEKIFKRTESLLGTGAVSPEDLDRDQGAFEVARAQVETLRQELKLKEEGYRMEEIEAGEAELMKSRALLELARNQYSYTLVKSPVDGVVLDRFVTAGTYVPAGDPKIVSLYDPGDLQVRIDVRLEDIGGVYLGQKVNVNTEAEPDRKYSGTVIRIEPKADFKKNTIQVKVKLLETSENLHPEMIAQIEFIRRDHEKDHGEN